MHIAKKAMEDLPDRGAYLKATQQTDGIAILQATATWCSQCKAIAPYIEKLVKQFPEARFYKYDVDAAPDIAHELGVSQMPTFTVFNDGEVESGVTGNKPRDVLKAIREVYKGEEVNVE